MPTDRAPGSARAAAPLFAGAALLDAEKLDCYRLAVAFQALTGRLLPKRSGVSGLRDQLDRASVSIVLNIADLSEVVRRPDGRIRILEHFTWRTRSGSGTNVFDELGEIPQ